MREHKGQSIIALPMDYVVLDVETTGLDYNWCEIIEVAALKYVNGACVDAFTSLVHPWAPIDQYIADLTGITNDMLDTAPSPTTVIPALVAFIGDAIVVGHNVGFDINFIYDAYERECGKYFSNNYIDTLRIARKCFPQLSHHRLSDIAEACNVVQLDAHRAAGDCETTAQCYSHMRSMILAGQTEDAYIKSFDRCASYRKMLNDIEPTVADIDPTNPLYGKTVVFTGALATMERKDALKIVANLGGIPKDSVTAATNYLVIGSTEFAKCVKDGKTEKMKKAETIQKKGGEITIISEDAFWDMINP